MTMAIIVTNAHKRSIQKMDARNKSRIKKVASGDNYQAAPHERLELGKPRMNIEADHFLSQRIAIETEQFGGFDLVTASGR